MLVTERNFVSCLRRLEYAPRVISDTETTGLHAWHGARIVGISATVPGARRDQALYFPFRHKHGGNLAKHHLKELLRVLHEAKRNTCWNGKFDTHMFMADGMPEPDNVENVDLLLHLLDENQHKKGGSYELKTAAERYLDKNARRSELGLVNLLADRGLGKGDMQELSPEEVEPYATDDVWFTEGLRQLLYPGAEDWEITGLWEEVNEYSAITRRMESRGFMIDRPLARHYVEECDEHLALLKHQMDRMAHRDINLRSYKQMQAWLELPSTAQDYIDEIEWKLTGKQKKAVAVLQEYRKWDKAKGSYYEPFLENCDREGAYHPNIKLHGTISGRPSSSGTPNPFALPRTTAIYKIKDLIVARPGYTLISADYAQMELRLAAHYAQDEFLIKCFEEGRSPHKLMQQDLMGQGVEIDYTSTKSVNFAIMYGTGAPTLSKELKKPEAFARQVLALAHGMHPNYRPMLKQTEDLARNLGYIRLWTGRVRHFDTLPDPQPWYHKACSNLIQGDVSEVMRVAITRISRVIDQMQADWHMLLQVYDQILFEVATRDLKHALLILPPLMTSDFPFTVPLAVDVKFGKRWGALKEVRP